MSNNTYIQSISYAKLAEYDQTRRTELPIRKYVLISNLIREEEQQQSNQQQEQEHYDTNSSDEDMMLLEQHWFEACLDELDREEEQQQVEEEEMVYESDDGRISNLLENYNRQVHLHSICKFKNGKAFMLYTSKI